MDCSICNKQVSKYTCPQCLIKYCSLPCFKDHKKSLCKEKQEQTEAPTFVEDKTPDRIALYETIDTVPPQKLEELRSSQNLKLLLRNPHLRKFLQDVNHDGNPWKAMQLAMAEPLFLEFADECLKIVDN